MNKPKPVSDLQSEIYALLWSPDGEEVEEYSDLPEVLAKFIEQLVSERTKALLEALEAVAPPEPMNQDEQGGCVWCGDSARGKLYCTDNPNSHAPDCAWVKARAILKDGQLR